MCLFASRLIYIAIPIVIYQSCISCVMFVINCCCFFLAKSKNTQSTRKKCSGIVAVSLFCVPAYDIDMNIQYIDVIVQCCMCEYASVVVIRFFLFTVLYRMTMNGISSAGMCVCASAEIFDFRWCLQIICSSRCRICAHHTISLIPQVLCILLVWDAYLDFLAEECIFQFDIHKFLGKIGLELTIRIYLASIFNDIRLNQQISLFHPVNIIHSIKTLIPVSSYQHFRYSAFWRLKWSDWQDRSEWYLQNKQYVHCNNSFFITTSNVSLQTTHQIHTKFMNSYDSIYENTAKVSLLYHEFAPFVYFIVWHIDSCAWNEQNSNFNSDIYVLSTKLPSYPWNMRRKLNVFACFYKKNLYFNQK